MASVQSPPNLTESAPFDANMSERFFAENLSVGMRADEDREVRSAEFRRGQEQVLVPDRVDEAVGEFAAGVAHVRAEVVDAGAERVNQRAGHDGPEEPGGANETAVADLHDSLLLSNSELGIRSAESCCRRQPAAATLWSVSTLAVPDWRGFM